MQELHIDTPEGLSALCDRLRHSPWLALDTEFMREKTYYPQLCLLQVSNGEVAASIDPLAIDDLRPFRDLLFEPQTVKVFHAGHQDLELFQQLWQELPAPLFDTQPAAELAGLDNQMGYARLVEALLDHQLDKGHTRTDWSRRPLQPEQLRYALDDVIYLGQVYLRLLDKLGDKCNDERLLATFARMADPATYITEPEDAWKRLKARKYLRGPPLTVLKKLAAWRESEAVKADKPRGWILSNEALFELAKTRPRGMARLWKIPGLQPGVVKRRGQLLLQLIAEADPE